jgi:hypothetical protein
MSWTTSRATASDVFNGLVIEPLDRIAIEWRVGLARFAGDRGTTGRLEGRFVPPQHLGGV